MDESNEVMVAIVGQTTFYLIDSERIDKAFTYHPPKDDQAVRYVAIRDRAGTLAQLIYQCCPPSTERRLALTGLEEAVMWANAAIARNE